MYRGFGGKTAFKNFLALDDEQKGPARIPTREQIEKAKAIYSKLT